MALICAISKETPENAVISPVSGCIYERRLIEKFIAENGTDPMNNEQLSIDMLIEVQTQPLAKPRLPSATSIPAILKQLQDEWDSVMLHSFTLRQQLQTARQELSHALYQHDAACRVIARLTMEVTAAREALATLKPQATVGAASAATVPTYGAAAESSMDVAGVPDTGDGPIGISDEILNQLQEKASTLTQERKKRGKNLPENLATVETIASYKQQASHVGLHSASIPGILSLDICIKNSSKVVTGGADKNIVVFNKDTEQIECTLKGHSKKVTSVIYHPDENVVLSASPDCTIRVWSVPDAQCSHIIKAHDAAVTGISLHPTGDFVLSSSEDNRWAFSDIRVGRVLTKVADDTSQAGLTCTQFHPDGMILGTGTEDYLIKIWDLKERTNVASFPGHSGALTCLAFSENGYYLASAADDSVIKLWDLRKLKNFKTISLDERYQVCDLAWDHSGQYLAVAGTDVRVYVAKQWKDIHTLQDHTALVTGVRFGELGSFIASTSMDRSLKFFGAP